MVVASAFEPPTDARSASEVLGAKLGEAQRRALIQSIRDRGVDYVAQEAVTLSSMPVWRDGRLQPRPFTLRLFLAKVGERWQVMPGGFVRIAENADARAVSLQRGAATADAWVLAHGPVAETTLLPTPERIAVPARHRPAAEPRRRQSVLGRALRRTRGSDAAADARHDQPGGGGRRSGRAGHRRHRRAARKLERRCRATPAAHRPRSPRARSSRAAIWPGRCRISPAPRDRPHPSSAIASRRTPGGRSTISPP